MPTEAPRHILVLIVLEKMEGAGADVGTRASGAQPTRVGFVLDGDFQAWLI